MPAHVFGTTCTAQWGLATSPPTLRQGHRDLCEREGQRCDKPVSWNWATPLTTGVLTENDYYHQEKGN